MATSAKLASAFRAGSALLIAAIVVACGGAPAGPVATAGSGGPPQATAAGGADPSPGQGTASELCGVFSPAELAAVLGAEPAPGSVGGPLESACTWDAGDVDLMIQKVPADYFEDHRGAEGYRELGDIGDYAFVAAHPFGRITAAQTADAGYVVIASDGTDELGQIEILRMFVERSPGAPVLAAPEPSVGSGPSGSSGSGSSADCPVSTQQISDVTGIPMVQSDGCSWAAADTGELYEVLLTKVPIDLFEYLRTQEAITGLGDEAYADGSGVYVRVGDRAVSVHVATLHLDETQQLDVATAIARSAVDGLR